MDVRGAFSFRCVMWFTYLQPIHTAYTPHTHNTQNKYSTGFLTPFTFGNTPVIHTNYTHTCTHVIHTLYTQHKETQYLTGFLLYTHHTHVIHTRV